MSKTTQKRKPGDACLAKMDLGLCAAVAIRECLKDAVAARKRRAGPVGAVALAAAVAHGESLVELVYDARAELAAAMKEAGVRFTPRKPNLAGLRRRPFLKAGRRGDKA